ncbi:MAG: sensor domain-containing diguanylate cyclase [Burkholderiales bacterium]
MRRLRDRLPWLAWRPRTITRVTFGVVSLTLALVLMTDAAFDILRDDVDVAREVRKRVSENVAIQMSVLARRNDMEAIERTVAGILEREPEVVSIGTRRADGTLVFASPRHAKAWIDPGRGTSTLTHVQVPLRSQGHAWGRVEIVFREVAPRTVAGWFGQPIVVIVLAMSVGGALALHLFLRRTLQSLDPSRSIPDSVTGALDTLAEGLMILDLQGRVLMVNGAFKRLHAEAARQIIGLHASGLPWLCTSLAPDAKRHPWHVATARGAAVPDVPLEIHQPDATVRHVRVNASPVRDAKGTVRGCFVSFNDVTVLHNMNDELSDTLADLRASQALVQARNRELEESKVQIEIKNRELERLANYDPLTGVMNRRAFMARANAIFDAARRDGTYVAAIMTDIDKFKSVNDTYGHAVGDEVIQQVARVLGMGLRTQDLLARYGGEEFVILLPGMDPRQALIVADRLRQRIETQAGPGVRSQPGMRVTSSFGVSELSFGAVTLPQMIEEADQALYASKQAGRNFATLFSEVPLFQNDIAPEDVLRVRAETMDPLVLEAPAELLADIDDALAPDPDRTRTAA